MLGEIYLSKKCGEFEVIEQVASNSSQTRWKVRFIDTNYETEAYRANIKAGRVMDKTLSNPLGKYRENEIITSKDGDKALILKVESVKEDSGKSRSLLTLKDIKTGYVFTATPDNYIRGRYRNYYLPTVCGVGMVGDAITLFGAGFSSMKEYDLWAGMIRRCYDNEFSTAYKEATVCNRWLRFDNFCEDLPKIIGYYNWIDFHRGDYEGNNPYELDKDLNGDMKEYSLENCQFVHKEVNAGYTSWANDELKQQLKRKHEENTFC